MAVLDALRGMFLDDELTKLKTTGNDTEAAVARQLQTNIDTRVDEVAPLSTTFAGNSILTAPMHRAERGTLLSKVRIISFWSQGKGDFCSAVKKLI